MKKLIVFFCVLITPLLLLSPSFAATTADIVFVVDESGSMSGEHAWIDSMVADLETALVGANVTGNTYSLVGFGDRYKDPNLLLNAGNITEFQTATDALVLTGGTEDGYDGIEYAFSNLTLRSNAALNVILITDEDRDIWDSSQTYNTTLSLFSNSNALLNAVVNASFSGDGAGSVLGIDADGNAYYADGAGGYTDNTGGTAISGYNSTVADYVDLAIATEGAAWNLNLLRSGGTTAESFTNAFVDIKVGEIQQQDPNNPVVPEPATALLFGLGLLGVAGIGRKKA